jgi:hypothetical protein
MIAGNSCSWEFSAVWAVQGVGWCLAVAQKITHGAKDRLEYSELTQGEGIVEMITDVCS